MPTYEYSCRKCKKIFEVFQKISDLPLNKCPTCGEKVTRLISAAAFSLKGGCWSKDGYSSSSQGKQAKKEDKSKKKSEANK